MAKISRPLNTSTGSVLNIGVNPELRGYPLGAITTVYDNTTRQLIGYMKDDSFFPMGAYAEKEQSIEKTSEKDVAASKRGPASLATSPLALEFDKYKLQVTTDPDAGTTYVAGVIVGTDQSEEHFIYVGANNKVNISANFDVIRNAIIKDATTQPGGLDALMSSMYSAGLISKDTFDRKDFSSPDFNKNLQYAIRNYSIDAIDDIAFNNAQKIDPFLKYLSGGGKKSMAGTTRTTTESYVTKRADAADDADRFFMQYLGRGATKDEEDAYYNALRELERSNIASRTATYDAEGNLVSNVNTGELVTDLDKTLLLGKVAGKAIKGSKVDKLLEAGGQAAGDIQQIMSLANQYGLIMTQEDAMDYVSTNLRKGKNIEQTKNKLIKLSQAKYQNIANLIDDDVSVKDIASQYIYDMSQILELNPQSISVNDPMIQSALLNNNNKGTMSITEFSTMLRKDPRTKTIWANTNNAKNTAAQYALEVLTSFGLVS